MLKAVARRKVIFGAGGLGFLASGLATVRAATSRTFYVSPSGDDARDGLSPDAAFRTVAAVNSAPLQEGDQVLFERGGTWRETLVANQHGITFAAYGSGRMPVITAADRVKLEPVSVSPDRGGFPLLALGSVDATGAASAGRTWMCCDTSPAGRAYTLASLDLNIGAPMTWTAMLSSEPVQVFVDGVRGERFASATLVDGSGKWCWSSGTLTVYGELQRAPDVEVSTRDYCFEANDRRNLVVQGLELTRASAHCVLLGAAYAPTIRGCRISEAFQNGIDFASYLQHDQGVIEDNLLDEHGQGGLAGGGRMSGWSIRRNTLRGCARLHNEMVGGIEAQAWTYAIKLWGWQENGWHGSVLIENNVVENCRPHEWASANSLPHNLGTGSWLDEIFNPKSSQNVIGNRVVNCQSRGIYFEKSDSCVARYNIIDNCGQSLYTSGLAIQGNFGRGASGNLVEFNTIRGGWWTAEFGAANTSGFDNNTVRYNIFVGSPNQQLYITGGGANASGMGSGNRYYRNCVGPERANFLTWQTLKSWLADFENASGGVAYGNIARDPMLRAPDAGDWSLAPGSPCLKAAPRNANIGAR